MIVRRRFMKYMSITDVYACKQTAHIQFSRDALNERSWYYKVFYEVKFE